MLADGQLARLVADRLLAGLLTGQVAGECLADGVSFLRLVGSREHGERREQWSLLPLQDGIGMLLWLASCCLGAVGGCTAAADC